MNDRDLGKEITLGFKVMSGHYRGAIGKDEISALGKDELIPWGTTEFETSLNLMGAKISGIDIFAFLASWRFSFMEYTSDAVALNFLFLTYEDWLRKAKPTNATSPAFKAFQKNAVLLLDRSIYEYVTRQWRGSSDSRIAGNISQLKKATNPEKALFDPIPDEKWEELINDVVDRGTINQQSYVRKVSAEARLLLYYYYAIKEIAGPAKDHTVVGIDLDHIIPQTHFDTLPAGADRFFCHNITNLALLPRKENIAKSNKSLVELQGGWLRSQVERYAEIPHADFPRFSNPATAKDLNQWRGKLIKEAFTEIRPKLLSKYPT